MLLIPNQSEKIDVYSLNFESNIQKKKFDLFLLYFNIEGVILLAKRLYSCSSQ